MAKFSLAYVKQNPVMFGAIVVGVGVVVYMVASKGAPASSTTTVASGPSEALQAAGLQASTQVQLAQIQAAGGNSAAAIQLEALSRQIEGQLALGALEMQYKTLELASSERLGSLQVEASLSALQAQLDNSAALTESNNQFMVDYARVATESATMQSAINAALQRDLSEQQLEGYKYGLDNSLKQGILATIPSLKSKDRDTALAAFMATSRGLPFSGGKGDDYVHIPAIGVSNQATGAY